MYVRIIANTKPMHIMVISNRFQTFRGISRSIVYFGQFLWIGETHVSRVEDGTGIAPFAQFIIQESTKPNIEKYLGKTDLLGVSFHKHRVVEE